MSKFALLVFCLSLATFTASGGYTLLPRELYDPSCNIKGNVSYNAGQHIYHVPGQDYYAETRISYSRGERWFCSEEDARKAGWRRATR